MPEIILSGPAGRIEARYQPGPHARAPQAVILHPHPLYGGSMNNKVTYLLYQRFLQSGFGVLRFNFRGVGRSEGLFDHGEGEMSDAACVLDWVQAKNPESQGTWIAGFSFGAWIAMQLLMRRPELQGFVAVSPPADKYDFTFLAPCPVSGMIIQGRQDEIVDAATVKILAARLASQNRASIDYAEVPAADHFFTNKLAHLNHALGAYLARRSEETPPVPEVM